MTVLPRTDLRPSWTLRTRTEEAGSADGVSRLSGLYHKSSQSHPVGRGTPEEFRQASRVIQPKESSPIQGLSGQRASSRQPCVSASRSENHHEKSGKHRKRPVVFLRSGRLKTSFIRTIAPNFPLSSRPLSMALALPRRPGPKATGSKEGSYKGWASQAQRIGEGAGDGSNGRKG